MLLPFVLFALPPLERVLNPPQDSQATPRPQDVVKTRAYVSLEPVPRGRNFEVAVVVVILSGYHMNAHKTSDEFLIPTTLTTQPPQGFREVETIYPEGHLKKFSFSDKPLNVYDGSITLRTRLEAGADVPLGDDTFRFVLRYQACNDTACLPPVKVPVSVTLKVAPAGTTTHSVHREIFANHAKSK